MKSVMMIFTALLTFGGAAHAFNMPGAIDTQIYYCNNESLQLHISRNVHDQNSLLMEDISNHRRPSRILEEKVSELTNKTHTIYTSNQVLLKITHHDSGFFPSTLIILNEKTPSQIPMTCQIVYQISGPK